MKRILIFGASGLVGSELVLALAGRGHQVIAPAHAEVDLRDVSLLESYVASVEADVVINAAGLLSIDALQKDPLPAWQINTVAAGAIARAASKRANTRLIYLSTQLVFDGAKPFYTEGNLPAAALTTVYGATKAKGEELVRHYATQANAPYFIVRTALVFGAKRPTFIDEVARTLQSGARFDAAVDQYTNLTYAKHLAEAMAMHFIDTEIQSGAYHLVNASDQKGVSRYEIAQEIARILGMSESLVGERTSDAVFATMRPNVALSNTRLPALPDWRDALREHFAKK